jgi:RNA polymerase sigma-70 factor, ECF subfamily
MAGGDLATPNGTLRLVPEPGGQTVPSVNDEEILAALREGKRGVGLQLYDRLFPVVDATLYRIFGAREQDHADLVQAAFEQIVSALTKRRFSGRCSLAGWASVVTCHVGFSALRSRKRERRVIDHRTDPEVSIQNAAANGDPERQVSIERELSAVREHLSEMDPERATALFLHVAGHRIEEIAQLAGVSVAAAQSRLSRGRRDLLARMAAARAEANETNMPVRSQ